MKKKFVKSQQLNSQKFFCFCLKVKKSRENEVSQNSSKITDVKNLVNLKDVNSKVTRSDAKKINPKISLTSLNSSSQKDAESICCRQGVQEPSQQWAEGVGHGVEDLPEDVESRPKLGRRGQPLQDREPLPGAKDVESRPKIGRLGAILSPHE